MKDYVDERNGGYYIAGTRVALSSVVHAFQAGESPDEILRSFPMAGPLVKIYGAITFYSRKHGKGCGVLERARPAMGSVATEVSEVQRSSCEKVA